MSPMQVLGLIKEEINVRRMV
ncbi:hypothetical protein HU200_045699 [Digitaria exilis]|uniref:Uncharacterized protein n=1 Tax=Digitaria exilis TaxID=1010633 RepID=A0A835AZK4_9POAL|nr:hypothetical protein HU200_045699 [Digitaria exilis]